MKHTNKRIGLELYPIDTYNISDTEWLNKVTNKSKCKRGQRGKMEERGQYLQSSTVIRECFRNMRF